MEIKKIVVGHLKVNCYIVFDKKTKKGIIIDPGSSAKKIIEKVKGLNIIYILNTHGHFDHIGENKKIKEYFNAKIAIEKSDAQMLTNPLKNYSLLLVKRKIKSPKADLLLKDGQLLIVDGLRIKVISIPGHSPGGVGFLINNHLFSGDILFKNTYGLSLSDKDKQKLIRGIKLKFLKLPDTTIVHPGHGPETTIKEEKKQEL